MATKTKDATVAWRILSEAPLTDDPLDCIVSDGKDEYTIRITMLKSTPAAVKLGPPKVGMAKKPNKVRSQLPEGVNPKGFDKAKEKLHKRYCSVRCTTGSLLVSGRQLFILKTSGDSYMHSIGKIIIL